MLQYALRFRLLRGSPCEANQQKISLELYGAGLCHSLRGNAVCHADQQIRAVRQVFHAVFRYVPPVLSFLCGVPPRSAQRERTAVHLEHRHGDGLSGADLLLSGVAAELAQRPGAGGVAAGVFLSAGAGEAGVCGDVLRHFPAKAVRQERCVHCGIRGLLRAVRLGTGVSVERDVAGHLRPAASGGAGDGVPAEGEKVFPLHGDAVPVRLFQLLYRVLYLHFRFPAVFRV